MIFDNKLVKKLFNSVDKCLGIDTYKYFNKFRSRKKSNCLVGGKTFEELQQQAAVLVDLNEHVKLHLGCGKNHFDGFINIDLRQTSATDFECDICRLPFADNSVELVETFHVIEHLPRHDVSVAIREWHRVLADNGKLVIECPDFDGVAREYVQGNESRIDNIFGLQRFEGDTHLFGYNESRLRKLLEDSHFTNIEFCEPQDYHKDLEPCLRVEATK